MSKLTDSLKAAIGDGKRVREGKRSRSTEAHRAEAATGVKCYVITVSDTRKGANDKSGAIIRERLETAGHLVVGTRVVRDEVSAIAEAVETALHSLGDVELLCLTGGSGIRPRDVTPEAVRPLLSKELPGFGEMFRVLSWEEVGPATMLSRAFAGVIGRTLVFAMPGSTNAVKLAMDKLIVPELGHLVREVRPQRAAPVAAKAVPVAAKAAPVATKAAGKQS